MLAISLTYLTAATSTIAMRYRLPDIERPFRLRCVSLVSTLGIFASSLIFIWGGWSIVSKAGVAIFIAILLLWLYRKYGAKDGVMSWNFRESVWFWFYIVAVTIASYFSGFGGIGFLNLYSLAVVLLIISGITVLLAKFYSLSSIEMQQGIDKALNNCPANQ